MKLNSGTVFCVPAPEEIAIPKELIDNIINNAIIECEKLGIKGKDITPFLLGRVKDATGGQSVRTNVEFVKNNAKIGAKIAICLASLDPGAAVPGSITSPPPIPRPIPSPPPTPSPSVQPNHCDALVIGSLATDLTCTLNSSSVVKTSYPGKIESAVGGVGHNITLAASYAGLSKVRLVSEVGQDEDIISTVSKEGLDISGISTNRNKRTARYVSMNDGSGELVVACADMDIIRDMSPNHIRDEIKRANAPIIFFDGNIGNDQKMAVISEAKRRENSFVGFEPTSVPKAAELARIPLNVYPNHDINLATPNIDELQAMFESFHEVGKFDVDHWFPVIDALGLNETLRLGLENLARSKPQLIDVIRNGTAQQALHLLPYIPNLLIKSGSLGVLSFQLLDAEEINHLQRYGPAERTNRNGQPVTTQLSYRDDHLLGVLVQHFPAFDINTSDIVSVSGAGDSFCGVLIAELAKDKNWLYSVQEKKVQVLDKAQYAASLAIQTLEPVNEKMKINV